MKKDTKSHIIEVALQLFAKEGMEKVSLNQVIKASGLSKGAVYHHFSSKKELMIASVISFWGNMSNEILSAPIEQMPLKDALQMIIQQFQQFFDNHDNQEDNFFDLYISMLAFVRDEKEVLDVSKGYFNTFNQKIQQSIMNDQERGVLNKDLSPITSALLIISCAEGHGLLSFTHIYEEPIKKMEQIFNQIYNSLLK